MSVTQPPLNSPEDPPARAGAGAGAHLRLGHRQDRGGCSHPAAWVSAGLAGFTLAFSLVMVLFIAVAWLIIKGVGIWGINIPIGWGFAIVNFVWWIGIGHAGTLISAILFLLNQKWRTSINRFAEAMTLFAVACAGIFPLIHTGRPWMAYYMFPYPSTMGIWPQFRSPLIWDVFAVSTYGTVSLFFWFVGLLPDLATLRDRAKKRYQQVIYGMLAHGLAQFRASLAPLPVGVSAAGRTGNAAGAFRAHRGELRFRRRHRSRLAYHDFSSLLRRRRHLFRLRHGADSGDSTCARPMAWKISSPCAIWRTWPR